MLEALPEFTSKLEVLLAAGFFGYLAGSIPFGILISKFLGLGDLRKVGSGNIGATNVLRTGNKFAAFLTLLLDFLKGVCTVLIIKHFFAQDAVQLSAFCALVGHCFPIWLRFRGGKGVATMFGAMLAFHWQIGVSLLAVWATVFMLSKISSLSGIIASFITSYPLRARQSTSRTLERLVFFSLFSEKAIALSHL